MDNFERYFDELCTLFSSVDSKEEAHALLHDLLTKAEMESLSERWQEIQLLAAGQTQRAVAKKLGVSISKVTRGAHALKNGSGGFMHFLQKLGKPVRLPKE